MSSFLGKKSTTKKESDKKDDNKKVVENVEPIIIENKETKKEILKKEIKKEENKESTFEKQPRKQPTQKKELVVSNELENKIENIENFIQSLKDGKVNNIIVNSNPQEINSLRQKVETLTTQLEEMKNRIETKGMNVAIVKSPSVIYSELLGKYKLPISITGKELKMLTEKEIPNKDDLMFMIRFKRNKTEFELLYKQQTQ